MIPAMNAEEFNKNYEGDLSFRQEAFQWYLLGRLDAMMSNLKRETDYMEKYAERVKRG